ncbi:MAG: STAS domain-containing protein [Actinomycetota bacterium]
MDLVLGSRNENGWAVLEVQGEVDLYTSSQLREAIVRLTEEDENRIVVDLYNVSFMDSSGLGVLVAGLKRARERGGELALVFGEGSVQKVFGITGLDKIFPTHHSVGEATGGA